MYRRDVYNKRGVEPKNIESRFDIDELFFSITDLKGKILASNNVFIRVAKFSKDELIGKPHNIIRHPDMPRAVFKALWDTIQQNKPFVGYVKNMAKDGSYYWVLACVYPILDEEGNIKKYLSIRIKPSSDIFKTIPNFYQDVLKYEYKEGMDKALNYMIEKIKNLGFKDYEEFSKRVFLEEIVSREKSLKGKSINCPNYSISKTEDKELLNTLCSQLTSFLRIEKYYQNIFDRLKTFLEINRNLNEKSNEILKLAGEIRLLSLNASIESYRIKVEGFSFSTLSQEMRKNAEYSEHNVKSLSNIIDIADKAINDTNFNTLSSKLQIDSITYFLNETVKKLLHLSISKDEQVEILQNIKDLFWLLEFFSSKLIKNINETKKILRKIYYNINELDNLIERLNFIHINGLIESAHSKNEGGNFTIIFSQMLSLVESAKRDIENINQNINTLLEGSENADNLLTIIQQNINKLEKKFHFLIK